MILICARNGPVCREEIWATSSWNYIRCEGRILSCQEKGMLSLLFLPPQFSKIQLSCIDISVQCQQRLLGDGSAKVTKLRIHIPTCRSYFPMSIEIITTGIRTLEGPAQKKPFHWQREERRSCWIIFLPSRDSLRSIWAVKDSNCFRTMLLYLRSLVISNSVNMKDDQRQEVTRSKCVTSSVIDGGF